MQTPSTENDILAELYRVVRDRCCNPSPDSYVSCLVREGVSSIHDKVLEEARELVDASASGNRAALRHEAADLIFHCLVLLGYHAMSPSEVLEELRRRRGISGLTEKAMRKNRGR